MTDFDTLLRIWTRQRDQQASIFPFDRRDVVMNHRMVADYALGLHQETAEIVRMIYSGQHVLQAPNPTRNNVALAGVDVFKYLISIMDLYGVTPDEFVKAFFEKSDVVDHKIRSQSIGGTSESAFLTDLDDCVADWSLGFADWCGKNGFNPPAAMDQADHELSTHRFYDEGGFLGLEVIEGAREALAEIRSAGIKIVVVTARPRWEHERIYGDTLRWLSTNRIDIDAIFWGKDKADIVFENVYPTPVLGFIEDRLKHVLELADAGIDTMMFHRFADERGDQEWILHDRVSHLTDWSSVAQTIINRSKESKDG